MRKVEYIQATGTQWINTGVKVQAGLKVEMDIYLDKVTGVIFGSHYSPIIWSLLPSTHWKVTQGSNSVYTLTSTATANTRYNISYDYGASSQTIIINNVTDTISTSLPSSTGSNIYIFARNDAKNLGLTNNSYMRLYSFKIYQNGSLIRNFIPVLDNSGVACLYDKVGGQYYYNQGVGEFFCFEAGLIFDRTLSDVTNATLKGHYNACDLNRVERWCRKLADDLNAVGYNINITTKTDWYLSDFANQQNLERIRQNIKKIMQGYHYITNIKSTINGFDYTYANNWEKILNEIYYLVFGMENYYVYSGVSNSGQTRFWQNRFRQFYDIPQYEEETIGNYITTETGDTLTTENGEDLEVE